MNTLLLLGLPALVILIIVGVLVLRFRKRRLKWEAYACSTLISLLLAESEVLEGPRAALISLREKSPKLRDLQKLILTSAGIQRGVAEIIARQQELRGRSDAPSSTSSVFPLGGK